MMMPSPCGVPRSSTAWAIAIPIQNTPNVVKAIPEVTVTPSRGGIAIASRNMHRQERDRGQQHLALVAELRRDAEPDQRREAGQLDRPHALVHPEQLVQAQEPERHRARP